MSKLHNNASPSTFCQELKYANGYYCHTSRVAEVQFSLVLPPLGENLKLDLNLNRHLVQNHKPELLELVLQGSVHSLSRFGPQKNSSSHKSASAATGNTGMVLLYLVITQEQSGYISHYQLAQMVSSHVLQLPP